MNTALPARYRSLVVLTLAAGSIYPMLYLRQNFEVPLLEALQITLTELNTAASWLGVVFMLSYAPSGWLADRVDTKKLLVMSLAGTGLIGLYFAQLPAPIMVPWMFAAWGITTGLTFWSALIKEVNELAGPHRQGRFFGFLEGGRGLVEALLATIAVVLFTRLAPSPDASSITAMTTVIYFYASAVLIMAGLTWYWVPSESKTLRPSEQQVTPISLSAGLKQIVTNPKIWLVIICVLTGYQFLWATYSFSGYLQNHWGLTTSIAASITLAKLWTRPVGALLAGFLGDRYQTKWVLSWSLLGASAALSAFALLPALPSQALALTMVMAIGLTTYSVRGLYWAVLDDCDINPQLKGLAIGFISLLAFTPDIYLPKLNSELVSSWPDGGGYTLYFGFIALGGIVGALAARRL